MPLDRYPLALGAEVALLATAIAVLLGVSLGWILQNRQFPGKRALVALATAAMALPAPLLCYYLLAELGHVWPLTRLGLTSAGVVSVLPFLLRRSRARFAVLNPAYAQAARSLGASEWRVFAHVELPLMWRPLLRAAALALVRLLLELTAAFWIAEFRV
jgi:ABC-type sulfate transport system permease component